MNSLNCFELNGLYTVTRLVVEGREDQELDLSQPLKEIKKTVISIQNK